MESQKKCIFYRVPDHPNIGIGIGYCDLGIVWAICEGDVRYCEEPDKFVEKFYGEWRKRKRRGKTILSHLERAF